MWVWVCVQKCVSEWMTIYRLRVEEHDGAFWYKPLISWSIWSTNNHIFFWICENEDSQRGGERDKRERVTHVVYQLNLLSCIYALTYIINTNARMHMCLSLRKIRLSLTWRGKGAFIHYGPHVSTMNCKYAWFWRSKPIHNFLKLRDLFKYIRC